MFELFCIGAFSKDYDKHVCQARTSTHVRARRAPSLVGVMGWGWLPAAPRARPVWSAKLPTWLLIPLLTLSLVGVDVAVDDAEVADKGDSEQNPD